MQVLKKNTKNQTKTHQKAKPNKTQNQPKKPQ